MSIMKPPQSPQSIPEHHLEWNDRLQDWLDGEIESADAGVFEAHVGECPICQQRLAQMEQLESGLLAATPHPTLDASFDARLFEKIDAFDDAQRAAARRRVEQELQENLSALSRSWRRMLAFTIPGIVGGIAVAFALAGYFDASGLTGKLAESASEIGGNANLMYAVITALLGAGIGGLTAGWLSRAAA
jgi:anti-sigma factor RsiW